MKFNKKQYHSLTVCLSILLIFAGVGSFFLLKKYVNYRTLHPPATYVDLNSDHDKISGLVFHWNLDETIDGTTPDSSKNKIDGKIQYYFNDKYLSKILYNPPKISTEESRKSLQFTGKQWISAGNKTVYNSDQFTISLWVWQENDDIYMPTIVSKSSWHKDHDAYDGWWLVTTPPNRFIDIGIAWGSGQKHIESGYKLPLKEWHHVAVTVNRTLNEIQFYIDGKPFGKKHTHVHHWLKNWNHDLFIASYDASQRWPWYGKIDNVRFYNTIVNSNEIAKVYSEESGKNRSPSQSATPVQKDNHDPSRAS